jgi:hypothetical protein
VDSSVVREHDICETSPSRPVRECCVHALDRHTEHDAELKLVAHCRNLDPRVKKSTSVFPGTRIGLIAIL